MPDVQTSQCLATKGRVQRISQEGLNTVDHPTDDDGRSAKWWCGIIACMLKRVNSIYCFAPIASGVCLVHSH
jgi:hypothetical protein